MQDEVVSFGRVVALVESMACPEVELRLFRGGDHRLNQFKDEIAEGCCAFFARHLGQEHRHEPMESEAPSFAG